MHGLGIDIVSFTCPGLLFNVWRMAIKLILIITDLRMSCLSGIDIANKIRIESSSIKISLITTFIYFSAKKQ